jgi:hypothetical protein
MVILKISYLDASWLKPIVLPTWEEEIRKITVLSKSGQKANKSCV